MKVQRSKGELTAFLAILFALMTGFICAVLSVVTVREEASDSRGQLDLAIYSVFGEYHTSLLEHYRIFGMDAGYGAGSYSEEALLGRLRYYGADELDMEITDLQFLTDNGGAAFYEQVLFYMETIYGVELIRDFTGLTAKWEEQMIQGEDYVREKDNTLHSLVQSTEKAEELENYFSALQDTGASNFLKKVLPSDFSLSSKYFDLSQMPSRRGLNKGFGSFRQRDISGVMNRLLFGEYLLQNLAHACQDTDAGGMEYEVEYVIAGKDSDRDNLEAVAKKIALLRFVPNYTYLLTDQEKRAEAESISLLLCSIVLLPEMTEVMTQAILLTWAYEESLEDVRTLLSGGSVSLMKNAEGWNSNLELLEESSSLVVNGQGNTSKHTGEAAGMHYEDYLRILLFLNKRENSSMRSLDAMEYALRYGSGDTNFCIDLCVAKMRVKSKAFLMQGITYEFPTEFMYK